MDFESNRPIYLQIMDNICEKILDGTLHADGRISSVRELGAQLGVNPNTIMRTYEKLTNDGIIYNKRGLGYYVSSDAKDRILVIKRKEFIEEQVPKIKKQMSLLGIGPEIFD